MLLVLLVVVDASQLPRNSTNAMLLGAYRSDLYLYDKYYGDSSSGSKALFKTKLLQSFLSENREICTAAAAVGGSSDLFEGANLYKINNSSSSEGSGKVVDMLWRTKDPHYELLLEYILRQRCVLGCGDVLFEGGYTVPLLGWRLSPGLAEDFLLYVACNHSIFSCCFAARGMRYSRNFKKYSLIVQHTVSFFISSILIVMLTRAGIGSEYSQATADAGSNILVNTIVDMVLCTPISLFLARVLYRIYKIKLVQGGAHSELKNKIVSRLLTALMVLLSLSSLVLLSLLTTGSGTGGVRENIIQYLWSVLMASIVYDLVFTVMLYQNKYYYSASLCYGVFNPIKIGQYYLESLAILHREEGRDFVDSSYVWFNGLIAVDSLHPPVKERPKRSKSRSVVREGSSDDIELNTFDMYPSPGSSSSSWGGGDSVAADVMKAVNCKRVSAAPPVHQQSSFRFQAVNPMHAAGVGSGRVSDVAGRSSSSALAAAPLSSPGGARNSEVSTRWSEMSPQSGQVALEAARAAMDTEDCEEVDGDSDDYDDDDDEEDGGEDEAASRLARKRNKLLSGKSRRSFVERMLYWEVVGFAGGSGRANPLSGDRDRRNRARSQRPARLPGGVAAPPAQQQQEEEGVNVLL